ncbi:hypothetical protein MARPU_05000 [Marichromatium purpuratum 984]|uniref:Phytoene synthase n=1 Tax=Marichromatium purpuratum 984 TaxID=765910 RepID=W0E8J9_MARPU|nr:squalene/phytoene synthase family protein [Marichromatium purpuratum]AHF05386.1 hypothetical protein MARPU_05000 [Marichromatium purpuratum 984]
MSVTTAETAWRFPNDATPLGSARYYALRFAPAARRDALALLVLWHARLRAIPEAVSEARIGAAKLDWWREEIERCASGAPTHPLGTPLAALIAEQALPLEPFIEVIAHQDARLAAPCPPHFEALAAHAETDLGALFELLARCEGERSPASLREARALGAYCRLIAGIRDGGWWWRRGQLDFISADLLPSDQGQLPERLPTLLATTAARAEQLRAEAQRGTCRARSVRIRARLARVLAAELAASDYAVVDQRIALPPLRKLWHAWREQRR